MIGTEESAGKMPTGPTAKMAVLQLRARRARPSMYLDARLAATSGLQWRIREIPFVLYDRVGENYLPR